MNKTIQPAPVRKSVVVHAAPARAFEVFTARIGSWWPKSHHIGTSEPQTGIIEPREGGRWFERGIDGVECDIGHVRGRLDACRNEAQRLARAHDCASEHDRGADTAAAAHRAFLSIGRRPSPEGCARAGT